MKDLNCLKASKEAGIDSQSILLLSNIAKEAAIKGGRKLMEHYGKLTSIKSKGRSGDLVTNADLASEKLLIEYLNKETPDIDILGEESGLNGSKDSLYWCLDPLDGTTNFAHGYPFFATSVGLVWKNKPILGAISVPFLDEIFWCAPGIGSFCNNNPIQVSSCSKLIDSLLVSGFAYDRYTTEDNNYAEFIWLTHRTRGVRRGGAAAVDLAYVAAGRLDGYWERGLSPWDLAAGIPLVEIAGGIVSDYPIGQFDLENGRVLACAKGIHKEIQGELSKVIPLDKIIYGSIAS